jgi:hypothetical protein
MPMLSETHNRSTLASVLDWWSNTRDRWARMAELRDLPPGEMERVAADFGVSPAELVEASARPDGTPELLERRLAALDIDKDEIANLLPVLLRDLQRTCSACPGQRRCAHDMKSSELEPGWESYCPNSGTLQTLL